MTIQTRSTTNTSPDGFVSASCTSRPTSRQTGTKFMQKNCWVLLQSDNPPPFLSYLSVVIRNYTTPGCNNMLHPIMCSLQELSYYIISRDKSMVSVVTWCAWFSILVFHTNPPMPSSHQPLQRNYQHWMTMVLYRCTVCYGNIGLHKTS